MAKMSIHSLITGSNVPPAEHTDPKIGIEIELENVGGYPDTPTFSRYWNVTGDGSLRNHGHEFVSHVLSWDDTNPAIDQVYTAWRNYGYETHLRCGIHVHMDCTNRYLGDLAGTFATYAIVEPALFKFCGSVREENIYCVPWYRSPREADRLARIMFKENNRSLMRSMLSGLCKYSALNAGPLMKFGTIEYRHAPTWADPLVTKAWLGIVRRTFLYGRERTPTDVLDMWHSNPRLMLRTIFGPTTPEYSNDRMIQQIEDTEAISVAEKFLNIKHTPKWGEAQIDVEGVGADGLAERGVPEPEYESLHQGQRINPPPEPAARVNPWTITDEFANIEAQMQTFTYRPTRRP